MKRFLLFLLCTLSLFVGELDAQIFPVQVNSVLIPPYHTQLSSYATETGNKINLQLLMTDLNESNRQVKLRMYIEGKGFNIRSNEFVIGVPPLFLSGGVPVQLTSFDLRPYFELQNLQGISPQQYSQSLPEGMYQFCWEVLDAITNQPISRKSCVLAYLSLNDPPILNIPQRGEEISEQNPVNIVFQWTPRHLNAIGVSYDFELREIWDTYINPQAAFLASPPYHTETTFSTSLLYNIAKPTLIPGKTYGWRVRAKSVTGLTENSVFKNDGYSEIFHFVYKVDCQPPLFPFSEALSSQKVKITWQYSPKHNKYHVQYKRSDVEDAEWFEVYTFNNQVQISNLEPGKTYDFRVGGTCDALTSLEQTYTYSTPQQFTMPEADEVSYNCGLVPEISIANTTPLPSIGVNETFTAGDFPVTVKEVYGSNGVFSGWGFIVVPYLADTKIEVGFDNIKINSGYQMIDGVVVTEYDPEWGEVHDVGEFFDDLKQIIIELLALDITKATKKKMDALVAALTENAENESLPEEIKTALIEAAEDLQTAQATYEDAKAAYKEAKENGDTEAMAAAEEQMKQAESDYEAAQAALGEANEAKENYLKEVQNLLKKAIKELYRDGEDKEAELQSILETLQSKEIKVTDEIEMEGLIIVSTNVEVDASSGNFSQKALEYSNAEKEYALILFADLLGGDNIPEATFKAFVVKAKSSGHDFVKTVTELKKENTSDSDIIVALKEQLTNAFTDILLE